MHASLRSAAPPPGQASGTNATSQKHFEALWKSMITRVECSRCERVVHPVLSKIFSYRRDVQ